jgi:DNA-binding CsgD family transcriptional regulator
VSHRTRIAQLAAEGRTPQEIALSTGLAGPTVAYHLGRLAEPAEAVAPDTSPAAAARTQVPTREAVARLLADGLSRLAIARTLGLSKSTVSYHARRLGEPVDERGARRYDWAAVQAYYDEGHSVRECVRHFGFSHQTWHAAMKRGAVVSRPQRIPIERLCAEATPRNRWSLKRRLFAEGLKEERCEACGLTEWLGAPLSMALHHVNGERDDNRLESLQILCPNCHAQTSTWSGRRRI